MLPRRGEKKYLVLYECGDEEVRAEHRWRHQSSSEAVVMCPGCLFVWPIEFLNFDIDIYGNLQQQSLLCRKLRW